MNNTYRKLMEQQRLSEQANSTFFEKLENAETHRRKNISLKVIVIAACICLLIPTAVIAAENIFGIGLVEFIERNITLGSAGEGYNVNFTNVYSRPITDFSPTIQRLDGSKSVGYDTWDAAEAEIGIDLITNSILSDKKTYPEKSYDLQINSGGDMLGSNLYHCVADYDGKGGQFYKANITAAYTRGGMYITTSAIITAEHPAISREEEAELHRLSITYPQEDVEQISQEQYEAKNGLIATIVVIDRVGILSTCYDASFVANGVSYQITVDPYTRDRDAEAKELLIDILEGFSF